MDKNEFAKTIKAKYPQYSDIPDMDLADRMLAKYPQYNDMIDVPNTGRKQTERSFASTLPAIAGGTIGGILGGLATGPGGGLGAIPAAGIGYATGEQLYRLGSGKSPMQPAEFGKEAAMAGGMEFLGGTITKGAVSLIKISMPSILRTMQGVPNAVGKWVIERGAGKTLKDFTKVDPELPSQLINAFQETIKEGRRIASEKYGQTIDAIISKMAERGKGLNIAPVYKKTSSLIDDLTSDPSFSFSVEKKGMEILKNIKISLTNFKTQDIPVGDALKLRKGLDAIIEYVPTGRLPKYGNKINSTLKSIRRDLDNKIKTIPQIKKADAAFAEIAQAYDTVEPILKGTDLEVKVLNILKRGTDASRKLERIDQLVSQKASYLDDIRDAVAKVAFKEPIRSSVPFGPLALAGATTGGVIGGIDTFIKSLSILPILATSTSPRLAGHVLKAGEKIAGSVPAKIARRAVPLSVMAEYEKGQNR